MTDEQQQLEQELREQIRLRPAEHNGNERFLLAQLDTARQQLAEYGAREPICTCHRDNCPIHQGYDPEPVK